MKVIFMYLRKSSEIGMQPSTSSMASHGLASWLH